MQNIVLLTQKQTQLLKKVIFKFIKHTKNSWKRFELDY